MSKIKYPDSEEEKNKIINLYIVQKLPGSVIYKQLLFPQYSTFYKKLKKYKIKTRKPTEANRRYTLDSGFLSSIKSKEAAQVLGLWYADGFVFYPGCSKSCKQYGAKLSLSEEDLCYLENVKNLFGTDIKLGFTDLKKKNPKHHSMYHLALFGEPIYRNFEKLGCVHKKTLILKFPTIEQVPLEFLNSFALGYFEGDGCLYISKKRREGEFSIIGTREICEGFRDLFWKELKITSKISKRHKNRDNNNYTLKVLGNFQILKLMDWLYKDCSFKMERKYLKYIEGAITWI
jgi:hypothetical protein